MSFDNYLALFGAMILLAMVPGPAVFAVVARSFSSGFSRGLLMIIGITLGDFIFILFALFGLSVVSEIMGTTFFIIKYVSAAYLIWLGYHLIRSKAQSVDIEQSKESSLLSNLVTGLLINLGNPKAILFYIGLFPAFIDVSAVEAVDVMLIMTVAAIAFGSINICYALLAIRAKRLFKSANAAAVINKTAGTIMISTGALVAARG